MSASVTVTDVQRAAARISGFAVRTPILRSSKLDELCNACVYVKAEGLQHTGSFKFRGAFNRLSALTPGERKLGVVAWSSGNHAQGVAAAAHLLDIQATVVMPSDAPRTKIEGTRRYGARIVFYDPKLESREAITLEIAGRSGATVVPSFEDPLVIAGQGTVGMELLEELGPSVLSDACVHVPCGGGGLIAGVAIAIKSAAPKGRLFSVEPAGFDDTARSLTAGALLGQAAPATSICDALLAPQPGKMTFAINRELLAGGLVVSDAEAVHALAFAFHHLKLVLEPGGAVALAAALQRRFPAGTRHVVVVTSGANVDALQYAKWIQFE